MAPKSTESPSQSGKIKESESRGSREGVLMGRLNDAQTKLESIEWNGQTELSKLKAVLYQQRLAINALIPGRLPEPPSDLDVVDSIKWLTSQYDDVSKDVAKVTTMATAHKGMADAVSPSLHQLHGAESLLVGTLGKIKNKETKKFVDSRWLSDVISSGQMSGVDDGGGDVLTRVLVELGNNVSLNVQEASNLVKALDDMLSQEKSKAYSLERQVQAMVEIVDEEADKSDARMAQLAEEKAQIEAKLTRVTSDRERTAQTLNDTINNLKRSHDTTMNEVQLTHAKRIIDDMMKMAETLLPTLDANSEQVKSVCYVFLYCFSRSATQTA